MFRYINNETDVGSVINQAFYKAFMNIGDFQYRENGSLEEPSSDKEAYALVTLSLVKERKTKLLVMLKALQLMIAGLSF